MRKLALMISHFVVRFTSPGSKDWAEGLAREVAFIESDWSALAWALGSTKVLLDYRRVPIASLDDVPAEAQKFVKSWLYGGGGVWWIIFQGPLYLWKFFDTPHWPERTGCLLVVLSSISAGTFFLMERRRLKEPPCDKTCYNVVACAQFYRAELERRLFTVWIPTSALFGWLVGAMLAAQRDLYFHTVYSAGIVLLALICAPVVAFHQRNTRRKIERLDALLADRS